MEVKRQMTTVIESNKPSRLPDSGSGLTKSMPIDSQG